MTLTVYNATLVAHENGDVFNYIHLVIDADQEGDRQTTEIEIHVPKIGEPTVEEPIWVDRARRLEYNRMSCFRTKTFTISITANGVGNHTGSVRGPTCCVAAHSYLHRDQVDPHLLFTPK
ncbi:hypothetical protein [Halomarina ordinaria]|uniref:PLAT domain-containing protein n=1 Tax=Halomarina ordinaria TaxID=3033939 RepID=A0ABD5UCW1_9EURY|nr:hypothetical protein [Halomarina sp. PSRA2]